MESRLELTRRAVEAHFWFRGFRAFVLPTLASVLGGMHGLRVLDCGSGTGDNLTHLSTYGRPIGVDLSFAGVAHAHRSGFATTNADVTCLPFPSAVFDAVTSFDVLQCVPQDDAAVAEMARVLKPGGVAVLTMAALECLRGDHSEVWEEAHRYTPASARMLLTRAGLVPERVSFLFATLFPILYVSRTVQRLTRSFRARSEDSDIRVPMAPVNALLSWCLRSEARLGRLVPMPFGSSLLVVARKPLQPTAR
jgi:ubiquinone/menaquinone biosynthesis C-methylase UbiE